MTEAVATNFDESYEVISTEDLVARIVQLNEENERWSDHTWWSEKESLNGKYVSCREDCWKTVNTELKYAKTYKKEEVDAKVPRSGGGDKDDSLTQHQSQGGGLTLPPSALLSIGSMGPEKGPGKGKEEARGEGRCQEVKEGARE